jgi:hypothetical protein
MKVQAMASALRVTLTLREARALQQLALAGRYALNFNAPDQADELAVMLDIGVHDLASKQAEARARRLAKSAKPQFPPMINMDIDGFTISAELSDWIDISATPDYCVWATLTPERESGQYEIRRNAWRVNVLNPDRDGPMHLANGCTETDCRNEVEALSRKLVGNITRQRMAA